MGKFTKRFTSALKGAGAGFLVGGPLGALVGAGVGVTSPGLISGSSSGAGVQAPNVDFLHQPVNAGQSPNYDFLRNPVNLTSGYKGYTDFYKAPTATSGGAFNDYIGNVNAPSSVDAVRSGMNKEQLDMLLGDIQRDTKQKFGSDLSDYFGRGLIEPGVGASSDIASIGLAQTAAEGGRTAANARLSYSLADLDRLKAREDAARQAYGQRYAAAVGADTQANALASQGVIAGMNGYNDLLKSQGTLNSTRDTDYAKLLSGDYGSAADRQNARDIAYYTGQNSNYESELNRRANKKGLLDNISLGVNVCFSPDTFIEMADGSQKRIGDIGLGEDTRGGIVLSVRKAISDEMCDYKGINVTAQHSVLDNGEWKRVKDTEATHITGFYEVISLITTEHRIYVNGITFDDEQETVFGDSRKFAIKEEHIHFLNAQREGKTNANIA